MKHRKKLKAALFGSLLAAVATAQAQAVYRCGPDGRSYSREPCAGGKAVDVSDPRSPEQCQAAEQMARDDARRAREMAAENRQRQRKQQPAAAAVIALEGKPALSRKDEPRAQPHRHGKTHKPKLGKPAKPEAFEALGPADSASQPPKKKRKPRAA
ncbi:MAG TPA: hypothetical protein VFV25_04900 [Methylibium sp.]